ncbi:MAG: hypothetical protein LQ351_002311 [Letrouitia transgressa]|nr:MAG: hypothetical protein LQ351_002311 [Letrouitia transgressa]
MNTIREIQRLNKLEIEKGVSTEGSWHRDFDDTAYIYIGGLPFDLSEGDIVAVFSQYGEPTWVKLVRDKDTGKSKGFAFLKYEDQRSTDLAVDNLGGAEILGRILKVDHTRYKKRDDDPDEEDMQFHGADGATESESDEEEEKRPMLKEEKELAALLREHDEEDPMKEYLVQEKKKEVVKALAVFRKKGKKEDERRKRRHHHRHKSKQHVDEHEENGRQRGHRRAILHGDELDRVAQTRDLRSCKYNNELETDHDCRRKFGYEATSSIADSLCETPEEQIYQQGLLSHLCLHIHPHNRCEYI